MEKLGIKETLEIIDGVEVLAKAGAAVLKDGKVSMSDVSILMKLAKDWRELADAVEGADKALLEMKDLGPEEGKVLLDRLWKLVSGMVKELK